MLRRDCLGHGGTDCGQREPPAAISEKAECSQWHEGVSMRMRDGYTATYCGLLNLADLSPFDRDLFQLPKADASSSLRKQGETKDVIPRPLEYDRAEIAGFKFIQSEWIQSKGWLVSNLQR